VIGVRRQDYANLHNWVCDLFNTFLVMMHFHIQPDQVTILFLDGHPSTTLDIGWETIYNKPVRVGHLDKPVYFEHFIWGFQENRGSITEFKDLICAVTVQVTSCLNSRLFKTENNFNHS